VLRLSRSGRQAVGFKKASVFGLFRQLNNMVKVTAATLGLYFKNITDS
jgi:hypothetical protein